MNHSIALCETKQASAALAELAERINEAHQQAEVALNSGLQHALEAGRLLLEAKAQVGHGAWLPWLQEHFQGKPRTARTYVLLAQRWPQVEAKWPRAANLSLRQVARLTAPDASTSPTVPMPVEADYANFGDYYVAFMKAWWDDLQDRKRAYWKDSLAALKGRLAAYTTVQEVTRDHEPVASVRRRLRLEREELDWDRVADTVVKMCRARLAELESAAGREQVDATEAAR